MLSWEDGGQDRSRCPDAYLLLAAAVGGVLGMVGVAARLFRPYRVSTTMRRIEAAQRLAR